MKIGKAYVDILDQLRKQLDFLKRILAAGVSPKHARRSLLPVVAGVVMAIMVSVAAIEVSNIHNSKLLVETATLFTEVVAVLLFGGTVIVILLLFALLLMSLLSSMEDIATRIRQRRADSAAAVTVRLTQRVRQDSLKQMQRLIQHPDPKQLPHISQQLQIIASSTADPLLSAALAGAVAGRGSKRTHLRKGPLMTLLAVLLIGDAILVSGPVATRLHHQCYIICTTHQRPASSRPTVTPKQHR